MTGIRVAIKSGCSLYPDCFTCPFPDCFLDAGGISKAERFWRNQEIKHLYHQGLSYRQIAGRFKIGSRQVERICNDNSS